MTRNGSYFKAVDLKGYCELSISDYEAEKTFDGTVKAISEAEARAKAKGYGPQKWLIVEVTWTVIRNADGNFASRCTNEKAIALYDDGAYVFI